MSGRAGHGAGTSGRYGHHRGARGVGVSTPPTNNCTPGHWGECWWPNLQGKLLSTLSYYCLTPQHIHSHPACHLRGWPVLSLPSSCVALVSHALHVLWEPPAFATPC
eukprot:3627961-Rhodomonas_salina.1